MKCSACGRSAPISRWRSVNIGGPTKTTLNKSRNKNFVSYYSMGSKNTNKYNLLYACPYCGTLRIKTPIDRK